MSKPVRSSAALLAAGLACVLAASDVSAQQGPPKFPVTVAVPLAKRVTQWDEYSGRFEAVASVEVRARVSGFIDQVNFKDGQIVKPGDLLFTLDKRPFQIAVESATADVAKALAQVEQTGADVERAEPLIRNKTITDQTYDLRRANLAVAQASRQAAEAALKNAQLNLEWTEVRAPIGGRVSDKKVNVGTLIAGGSSASPTLLTTIVSLDPIHFIFDVSEADSLRYARLRNDGSRPSSRDAANPVRIKLADEAEFKHEGTMNFVDNQLSLRSGTLRARALIDNKAGLFTPGMFGRLQLFGGDFDALLIPDNAVISDQARKIVFIVDDTDTVVARPVTLGTMSDGLRIVSSGLDKSSRVVIDGIANPAVRPGAKVAPTLGEIKAAKL